ncbi:MAG: MauE/DoxX family redox-associated membrane protein [Planctomycetaceae bacterium]
MTDHPQAIKAPLPDRVTEIDADVIVATGLRRTVAAAALALLILTWRLWMPLTDFPQVPLFEWAGRLPLWCDWAGFAAMCVGMVAAYFGGPTARVWRCGLVVFVIAFGVMVLVNQHRLQPWAYQFALIALVLVLVPGPRALALVRVLTVGIYFHSALSKLDFSFFSSHGQYLISGLTDLVGLPLSDWDPTVRRGLAALLPVSELLVAVGLYFGRTRRAALAASILMHASLIVALGPWSLDHKFPVLVWNGYFIAQNILLFGFSTEAASLRGFLSPADATERSLPFAAFRGWAARAIIGMAVLLPFLQPFGLFDVWPSWAVYASRPARVRILVASDAIGKLPSELQQHVMMGRYADLPCVVRSDRWSLEATKAPIYPEPRFQMGVAIELAERRGLGEGLHVQFESAANRWTGRRTMRTISGIDAIRREAKQFRLNAFPRVRPRNDG